MCSGNHGQFLFVFAGAIHGDNVGGELVKRVALALRGCDFCKLGGHIWALRIALQCFTQNLFGLRFATVGDVHLGLGHRIHFSRIDGAHAGPTELALHGHVVGLDHAQTGGAKHGVRIDGVDQRVSELRVGRRRNFFAVTAPHEGTDQPEDT